ncbi:MAG: ELM1/GtrOC1 family putative glycosyltransferase [bacterium]
MASKKPAKWRKKRILIVSDGKRGHLHQMEGVVHRMHGVVGKKVEIRMSKPYYYLLLLLAFAARRLSFSREYIWLWLSRVVRSSIGSLDQFSPDLILSAGSLTHPVTYLMGKVWKSRTVICMRPSVLSPRDFDLVVAPRHDRDRCRGLNVIYTLGAASDISEGTIFAEAVALYSRLKGRVTRPIGLLMGGNSAARYLDEETAREILSEALLACEENDLTLLCCSSRRTPAAVERMMEDELDGNERCGYMLIASRDPENPVPGIVGLCEVVVVTDDSVSMVSEIATGGKTAVVVEIGKKRRRSKFDRLFEELADENYIRYTAPEGLNRAITEALDERREGARVLDEAGKVALEIERRFFGGGGGSGVRME